MSTTRELWNHELISKSSDLSINHILTLLTKKIEKPEDSWNLPGTDQQLYLSRMRSSAMPSRRVGEYHTHTLAAPSDSKQ